MVKFVVTLKRRSARRTGAVGMADCAPAELGVVGQSAADAARIGGLEALGATWSSLRQWRLAKADRQTLRPRVNVSCARSTPEGGLVAAKNWTYPLFPGIPFFPYSLFPFYGKRVVLPDTDLRRRYTASDAQ